LESDWTGNFSAGQHYSRRHDQPSGHLNSNGLIESKETLSGTGFVTGKVTTMADHARSRIGAVLHLLRAL